MARFRNKRGWRGIKYKIKNKYLKKNALVVKKKISFSLKNKIYDVELVTDYGEVIKKDFRTFKGALNFFKKSEV